MLQPTGCLIGASSFFRPISAGQPPSDAVAGPSAVGRRGDGRL